MQLLELEPSRHLRLLGYYVFVLKSHPALRTFPVHVLPITSAIVLLTMFLFFETSFTSFSQFREVAAYTLQAAAILAGFVGILAGYVFTHKSSELRELRRNKRNRNGRSLFPVDSSQDDLQKEIDRILGGISDFWKVTQIIYFLFSVAILTSILILVVPGSAPILTATSERRIVNVLMSANMGSLVGSVLGIIEIFDYLRWTLEK